MQTVTGTNGSRIEPDQICQSMLIVTLHVRLRPFTGTGGSRVSPVPCCSLAGNCGVWQQDSVVDKSFATYIIRKAHLCCIRRIWLFTRHCCNVSNPCCKTPCSVALVANTLHEQCFVAVLCGHLLFICPVLVSATHISTSNWRQDVLLEKLLAAGSMQRSRSFVMTNKLRYFFSLAESGLA